MHQEIVILLHGIARTNRSMRPLESALRKAGYDTHNINYPSRTKPISELSALLIDQITPYVNKPEFTVHFVTHSMGGLVTVDLLSQHPIDNLGKIVLLGPPLQGSEIADLLQNNWLYKKFYGPAGLELTTTTLKNKSFGNFPTDVGVIAGNKSLSLFAHFILPKEHDGRVSVASTKAATLKDHIVLPVNHTFMMNNAKVIEQVIYFLKFGNFNK